MLEIVPGKWYMKAVVGVTESATEATTTLTTGNILCGTSEMLDLTSMNDLLTRASFIAKEGAVQFSQSR